MVRDDSGENSFSPPYNVPWATFLNTAERAANDLPNKIDRSYLDSMAGSIQTYVIAAFKSFELIDDEARPTGLKRLAAEPEGRPAFIAELLHKHYGPIIELGRTKSTSGELEQRFAETFPAINGESRKKAIRFFLSAAAYAQLNLSPLWKVPKVSTSSSGARRGSKRKSTPPPTGSGATTGSNAGHGAGDSKIVQIGEAGTATFSVNVNPLKMTKRDREFIFTVIDMMIDYEATLTAPGTDGGAGIGRPVGGAS
jgi:hypothetical protein